MSVSETQDYRSKLPGMVWARKIQGYDPRAFPRLIKWVSRLRGDQFNPINTAPVLSSSTVGLTITLDWTKEGGFTAIEYLIYRKVGAGSFAYLTKVAAGTLTYDDSDGLISGTTYTYYITAHGKTEDADSNETSETPVAYLSDIYIALNNAREMRRYTINPSTLALTLADYNVNTITPDTLTPGVGSMHFNKTTGNVIVHVALSLRAPVFPYPGLASATNAIDVAAPPVFAHGVRITNTNTYAHSRGVLYGIRYGYDPTDDIGVVDNESTASAGGGSAYRYRVVVAPDGYLYWLYKADMGLYKSIIYPTASAAWTGPLVDFSTSQAQAGGDGAAMFSTTHVCFAVTTAAGGGDPLKCLFVSSRLDGTNSFKYQMDDYAVPLTPIPKVVYSKGNYVYVFMESGELTDNTYTVRTLNMIHVFNFTDPDNPSYVGAVTMDAANRWAISDVVFTENHMYIAMVRYYRSGTIGEIKHADGYLSVYSLATPAAPTLVDTVSIPLRAGGPSRVAEENQDIGIGHPDNVNESRNWEVTF